MATILIADDDGHIREVVHYALEKAGFEVLEAADGEAALNLIANRSIDLAILDIVMPKKDGIEVCRQVTAAHHYLPVIFLTSKDEEIDRVLGLELGADDYVIKPFSPRELVARVKAVLRRAVGSVADKPESELSYQGICINVEKHLCLCEGTPVELTPTEFALLKTLMEKPGRVFSRVALSECAYGLDHFVTERTIDSHIRRLRSKLVAHAKDQYLETVHGVGYRFKEQT